MAGHAYISMADHAYILMVGRAVSPWEAALSHAACAAVWFHIFPDLCSPELSRWLKLSPSEARAPWFIIVIYLHTRVLTPHAHIHVRSPSLSRLLAWLAK